MKEDEIGQHSSLRTRIKSGAVLSAVVLLFLYFSYLPYVLNAFVALLSVIGTYELFRAAKSTDKRLMMGLSLLTSAVIPFILPLILSPTDRKRNQTA